MRKYGKGIACFFALNILIEVAAPATAWALTGGPSQPEVSSFEPVGTTEMVDLFSGDFTYNIPLFDIGGYPVNISYHGGVGMDEEASWVGLGWNINPGAINRGMRGVPDDFMGDEVSKEMHIKENKTWGLKFNTDLEIFGFIGNKKRKSGDLSFKQTKALYNLSKYNLGFGVTHNNYKGLGYSLDFTADIAKTSGDAESFKFAKDELQSGRDRQNKTGANSADKDIGQIKEKSAQKSLKNPENYFSHNQNAPKLNYSLNSQEGAGWDLSFSEKIKTKNNNVSIGPSVGLGYNSFVGMTHFDINLSRNKQTDKGYKRSAGRSFSVPIGMYSYVPQVNMSTLSTSQSFNATVGFDAFGGHPNMRLSGFYNTEELAESEKTSEAYGYLYEQESYWQRGSKSIMMDFNREKDGVQSKTRTHMPLTNHTYDVYSVNGQGTGGMYRPHRKTIGILHDAYAQNENKAGGMNDIGVEIGLGQGMHSGASYKAKVQRSSSGLWAAKTDNELLDQMDYRMRGGYNTERYKQAYFKAGGEQTPSETALADKWGGKKDVSLQIDKTSAGNRNLRFGRLRKRLNEYEPSQDVTGYTENNPVRNNVITYLTAEECSSSGLGVDPYIISYPQNYWTGYIKNHVMPVVSSTPRYGGSNGARKHHISEIITNSGDGMRYVYGLPAYNTFQREVNFAISKDLVSHPTDAARNEYPEAGMGEYEPGEDNTTGNVRGADNFFQAVNMPPYAHSYLLTGVLSPDYSDLTGDGITDDDYGSAVKFNYYKVPGQYQWRSPYEENRGNLDEGYISDNSDNKVSYTYGRKEIWYVQSMESKTHIAEFKLSPRNDGRGVLGENGGRSTADSNTLMKLDSIVIYNKFDLVANGSRAVPVKTIVFKYDYTLCQGVPNNDLILQKGKLTLKAIYFTYQNSGKGALNPYRFTYSAFNPNYSHVHYDRWGNYKYADERLPNRYYPYVDQAQKRDTLDKYASAWNLTQISLPSGGNIDVQYEADDYAYVQDKKAMQMMKIVAASNSTEIAQYKKHLLENITEPLNIKGFDNKRPARSDILYDGAGNNNNYLFFRLQEAAAEIPADKKAYLLNHYLKDEKGNYLSYIYYRFKVNMNPRGVSSDNFEYVSGYAELENDGAGTPDCGITADKKYGYVRLKEVSQGDVGLTTCNPICKQAWQMGMQNLRKVMYPGSDQSQGSAGGNTQSAILGLKNAFTTSLSIFTGPYQNLRWKHIAQNFEVSRSYIRLCNPDGFKVGGGARVKRITINDNWHAMDTEQRSGQYGQEFAYITKNSEGNVISSGVASYEPFIGGDENPFRKPVYYEINKALFPNLNEYMEEPFGESFFPSPVVGYSRVVVRNIPQPGVVATSTGKVVHEFYTAKDYPVITENTSMRFITNGGGNYSDKPGTSRLKKFTKSLKTMFNFVKRDYMTATQGYTVILNDMHGKPKSMAVFSALGESDNATEKQFTGNLISGTEYKYKMEHQVNPQSFDTLFSDTTARRFNPVPKGSRLSSNVWVMKENGQLQEMEIGTSYDIAVDARESQSHYRHAGLDLNIEASFPYVIPCPIPKYMVNQNLYQGAVVTKVIQQYGILEETVAYDHSSVVRTKNLVWDEQTGQVLLTATTNEFNDPIYNFTYPAHLAYEGMGAAYKNIDYETQLDLSSYGYANYSIGTPYLGKFVAGDELLMRQGDIIKKGWVLKADAVAAKLQVIDITGQPVSGDDWTVRIIRSGRRNLGSVPVGAVTTMNRDIFTDGSNSNKLVLDDQVVQSSAAVFSEEWQSYIDKATSYTRICDTLGITRLDAYNLLKSLLKNTDKADYHYYYNDTAMPPPISGIEAYNDAMEKTLKFKINKYLAGNADCGGRGFTIGDAFLALEYNASYMAKFKVRYKCRGDIGWKTAYLGCPIMIENSGGFPLTEGDSMSAITSQTSSTLGFNIYKNGTSYSATIILSATCFADVDCHYIRNCDYVFGHNINPYVNNIRGVWRQKEAFAFNGERDYKIKANNNTNVREDGLVKDYKPYWEFNNIYGIAKNDDAETDTLWVSTGEATLYAPEGNGLEEKDALGIYSSQLFGYRNTLVTAQAANARYRQIAFDNFEDYLYPEVGCIPEGHFNFKKGLFSQDTVVSLYDNPNMILGLRLKRGLVSNSNVHLSRDTAHSGVFSLCVKNGQNHTVTRKLDYSGTSVVSGLDTLFRVKNISDVITPFAPDAGKYVVSGWVYEAHSDQNSVNTYNDAYLNVKVYNGGTAVVDEDIIPSGIIIEKWQRAEGSFTIPAGADSIKVTLVNSGGVKAYYDDIRIHPFNSQMAGHVYHAVLMRVVAELDDNNYATFYEYDDEGSLVRVKRETERGIITVQESRKSIRKQNP